MFFIVLGEFYVSVRHTVLAFSEKMLNSQLKLNSSQSGTWLQGGGAVDVK